MTAYTEVDQRENRGADDLSITTVSPGLNKTAWGSQLTSEPTFYVGTSRLCELSGPETILNMGSYDIYLPVMRPDFVYTCLAQIFKELRLRLWLLQVEVCNRIVLFYNLPFLYKVYGTYCTCLYYIKRYKLLREHLRKRI